ncbi:hypothetical protein EJB05_05553, partial [Eragrostis curvula]
MPPRSHEFAAATRECPLPAELLLEIVARSDAATLVRCAASCKPLCRDIVSPAFISRVCRVPDGVVPPSLFGFLLMNVGARSPLACLSLAHPATPAAASFAEKHLVPFLSRIAPVAGLDDSYTPRESRNGLVLLWGPTRGMIDRLCVYDPMTRTNNQCTFVPGPPDSKYSGIFHEYVLLTAADGIGSSFLLLAVDFSGLTYGFFKVQTMQSNWCTWIPVNVASYSGQRWRPTSQRQCGRAAVLGSLIHWLMCDMNDRNLHIVTYDVCTATAGSVQLPSEGVPDRYQCSNLRLMSTPNGGLRLLVADKLTISVWLLSGNAGWMLQAVIDTEETVRSDLRTLTW